MKVDKEGQKRDELLRMDMMRDRLAKKLHEAGVAESPARKETLAQSSRKPSRVAGREDWAEICEGHKAAHIN